MGLGNPDHVMTHEASLLVRQEQMDREWFCYEDHGYKHIPGLLAWRVAKLLRAQPWPTPAIVPARARRGPQAPGDLLLRQPDPPAGARARAHGPPGEPRPRAVLAPGPAPEGWEGLADFI